MATQDLINAGFEVVATLVVIASIRRLLRDGKVRGIAPTHIAYGLGSAYWFTYYYAWLEQPASFAVAVVYAIVVTIWVGLMVIFTINEILFGQDL